MKAWFLTIVLQMPGADDGKHVMLLTIQTPSQVSCEIYSRGWMAGSTHRMLHGSDSQEKLVKVESVHCKEGVIEEVHNWKPA